ncbi:MAG: MATE family efflux transporter, partial [Spirochaetia bacterium]|nr:MATE family efflux transporter [Spirochaetia bacterium]
MDFSTRRILALAGPSVLSMLSFNLMQFADRIFLAKYNPTHFAAVLPSGLMSFTFLSFFLGAVGFVTALVSQYLGAGEK